MFASQIRKALSSDPVIAPYFRGVFSCDKLPVVEEYPCAVVANTDPASEPGEHWVCFYFDKDGVAEYFDSYGHTPPNWDLFGFYIDNSDDDKKTYLSNTTQLQGLDSDVCGHYCIAFLSKRCAGVPLNNIVEIYNGDYPGENDNKIAKAVNEKYNIKKKDQKGRGKKSKDGCCIDQCCCARSQKHLT